jgi:hypothetical protein
MFRMALFPSWHAYSNSWYWESRLKGNDTFHGAWTI